jgi:hypothetical protein
LGFRGLPLMSGEKQQILPSCPRKDGLAATGGIAGTETRASDIHGQMNVRYA